MLADLGQRAQQPLAGVGVQALVLAVVEIAEEIDAAVAAVTQRPRHLGTQRPGADNHGGAPRLGARTHPAAQAPADLDGHHLHQRRDDGPPQQHLVLEITHRAGGIAAQRQNRQQHDPGAQHIDAGAGRMLGKTIAARKCQRKYQQAQSQCGAQYRFVEEGVDEQIAQDNDAGLQKSGDQGFDRLRCAIESSFVTAILEHRPFAPGRRFGPCEMQYPPTHAPAICLPWSDHGPRILPQFL